MFAIARPTPPAPMTRVLTDFSPLNGVLCGAKNTAQSLKPSQTRGFGLPSGPKTKTNLDKKRDLTRFSSVFVH
jgi:hypothetical protein